MKYLLLFFTFFSCASSEIKLDEVYYSPKDRTRLINSNEYHKEIIARKDISPVCSDMILNKIAPSYPIILELKVLNNNKLKLLNIIYQTEDKDKAACIEEIILKYDFPSFSVVDYKKVYPNNTYYNFSRVFKCSNKNINQTIKYEILPYTTDDFNRSLSIWDYLIINLSSFAMGCA